MSSPSSPVPQTPTSATVAQEDRYAPFPARASGRARKPIARLGSFIDSDKIKDHDEQPESIIDDWADDDEEGNDRSDGDFEMREGDHGPEWEEHESEVDGPGEEEDEEEEEEGKKGKRKRKSKAPKEPKEPKTKHTKKEHSATDGPKSKAKATKQTKLGFKSIGKPVAGIASKKKEGPTEHKVTAITISQAIKKTKPLVLNKAQKNEEEFSKIDESQIDDNDKADTGHAKDGNEEEMDEAMNIFAVAQTPQRARIPIKISPKPNKAKPFPAPARGAASRVKTTLPKVQGRRGGFKGLQPKKTAGSEERANVTPEVESKGEKIAAKVLSKENEDFGHPEQAVVGEQEGSRENASGMTITTHAGEQIVKSKSITKTNAAAVADSSPCKLVEKCLPSETVGRLPPKRTEKSKVNASINKPIRKRLLSPVEIVSNKAASGNSDNQDMQEQDEEGASEQEDEEIEGKSVVTHIQKCTNEVIAAGQDDIGHSVQSEALENEAEDKEGSEGITEHKATPSVSSSQASSNIIAAKITSEIKSAIFAALKTPGYTSALQGRLSQIAAEHGETVAKVSRHWREVLRPELAALFAGTLKKSGKASMSKEIRRACWQAAADGYDAADWEAVAKETGMDTTKLKRHLREVMRKEGVKMINQV